jgi:hypothetical protein
MRAKTYGLTTLPFITIYLIDVMTPNCYRTVYYY